MRKLATFLTLLVAAIHFYIVWLEMLVWNTKGPEVFATLPADLFEPTTMIAANQGLYNGFLAAGLVWGRLIRDPKWSVHVSACFLIFVSIAGVFGAATVSPRILVVQTVPAVLALIVVFLSRARKQD